MLGNYLQQTTSADAIFQMHFFLGALRFNPTHRLRVCVRTEYVLAWCYMLRYLIYGMQLDYFQKKNVFTFDPTTGVEGVCKDRIRACLVTNASFPFNLICIINFVRKKLF